MRRRGPMIAVSLPTRLGMTFEKGELVMRFLRITADHKARLLSALMLVSMVAAVLAGAADCKWT